MNKELIIHVAPSQVEIALIEDKRLAELNTEQLHTGFAVGDIYLGKVRKIMPGLNAAFVNIGSEKDAFIHYLDLGPAYTTQNRLTSGLLAKKRGLKLEQMKLDGPLPKAGKIGEQLASGQSILVQVAKEAISTKGPRLTADISLAGRHVVLLPFTNKVNVSQKIRSNEERKRLKRIADSLLPNNYGVIIRTAAQGKSDEEISTDITSLLQRWESVQERLRAPQPPAPPMLLLGEMNRTTTIIRDLLNVSFTSIVTNDASTFEEVKQYIRSIAPEKEKIVRLYKGKEPIFDHFDISKQIKSLFAKHVSLKRGAYLIIEKTEALHVVDVNSGNRSKAEDQESTSMEVNLAAAEEIARQLRLRDMGGIIVIDFIDLHKDANRKELLEKMTEFMKIDRARHTILPISKFGLMQITRQRVRPENAPEVLETCPTCHGTGTITPSILLEQQIENRISYWAAERDVKRITLQVSPYVASYLRRGFPSQRMRWMWKYWCWIGLRPDQSTGFVETKYLSGDGKELA